MERGAPAAYGLPSVSHRRGCVQAILALTALYAVAYAVTQIDFFIYAFAFGAGSAFLVAGSRFSVDDAVMRPIAGMSLFGAFIVAGVLTESVTAMAECFGIAALIAVASFVQLRPGSIATDVRGIAIRRTFRESFISYDEISSVDTISSTFGDALRQIGIGMPTVQIELHSRSSVKLNIAPEEIGRFIAEVREETGTADEDDLFILPMLPKAEPEKPKRRQKTAIAAVPTPDLEPVGPRTRAPRRRRGDES